MPRNKSKQQMVSRGSTPVARKPQKNQISEFKESSVASSAVSYAKRMGFNNGSGPKGGSSQLRNVCKTEFIGSVYGSVLFGLTSYNINPGLATVFPWLSSIAKDWQQYRFNRFRVRYITRCATSLAGSIILSPQYNLAEGPPAYEQQAVDTQDAVEDVVWRELVTELDVKAMFAFGPRKQVRTASIGADLATYDAALVSVCTVGQANTDMIGKLYFDYDVDFFVPQAPGVAKSISQRISEFTFSSPQALSDGVATQLTQWITSRNPIGIAVNSAGVFTFPSGQYRLDLVVGIYGNANNNLFTTVYQQVNLVNTGPITRVSATDAGSVTAANLHVNSWIYDTNGGDSFTVIINADSAALLPVVGVYQDSIRFLITLI